MVDDTPEAAEAMKILLEIEGAQATIAESGAEALRLAQREDFDLVLSDISMPGMDGYELLGELRRRPRTAHVPAIALTGYGRGEDVERARAAGFTSHLTKPVTLDKLIKAVREVTGRHTQGESKPRPAAQAERLSEPAKRGKAAKGSKTKAPSSRVKR